MKTNQLDLQPHGLQPFMETLLQEAYWCETQLCQVLDSMKHKANSDQLKEALAEHLEETQNHVGRLEKILSLIGRNKNPIYCIGMQGLIDEGWQSVDNTPESTAVRDASLIIAVQKIAHYAIVCYGSLYAVAQAQGYKDVADLLEMTLAEEKKADAVLSRIALSLIHPEVTRQSATQATGHSPGTPLAEVSEETRASDRTDALLYDE